MDSATGVDNDDAPEPGCPTICICCTALLIFDDNLSLRLPTEAEFDELRFNDQIVAAQKMIRESHK